MFVSCNPTDPTISLPTLRLFTSHRETLKKNIYINIYIFLNYDLNYTERKAGQVYSCTKHMQHTKAGMSRARLCVIPYRRRKET